MRDAGKIDPALRRLLISKAELFRDMLGIGVRTGERHLASGKIGPVEVRLPGEKRGRGVPVRFDLREIEAWVANRKSSGELMSRAEWTRLRERKNGGDRPAPAKEGGVA